MRITLNTIGIVCELNPLHNGHKYIIDKAKEKFGADFVVLVMSGDYTQRGTPSIVSKEIRTKMALMAGADAVFELPVQYATGSAEYFASGAVSLLNSLGVVDHILFGTENGDIDEIKNIAAILNDEPEDYKKVLQENPEDNSTDYGFKIHQKLPENQEETEACRLRLRTIPLIP